jgi:hypothetical protein
LRLPAALLDGQQRRLRVEAIVGGQSLQLKKGEVELKPPELDPGAAAMSSAMHAAAGAPIEEPEPGAMVLALWPGRGARSAAPEGWAAAGGEMVRLGQAKAGAEKLARAHTVVFARGGDAVDPAAVALLQRSRPLSDVLTWDGPTEASRRPEARPLGLLLGETLGGAFAVRGNLFHLMGGDFAEALAKGDLRRAELLLAARPELRWTHLPARLARPGAADEPRPAPVVPTHTTRLFSVGIWPAWGAAAEASLRSLLHQAPEGMDVEVLAPAAGADQARALVATLGRAGLSVRNVDEPPLGTPGAWLAALTAAASGEVVIVCQAGVRLDPAAGAVTEIAAWASSPLAGAVTVPIRRRGAAPLAGLALGRTAEGWASRSAFNPGLEGLSRPVLAASASFLAIGRDKLAMLGEAAAERLPAGGVDLDLGLRLRRLGLACVLLGHLPAEGPEDADTAGEVAGAALAAFEADELAAAHAAYPAPGD